MNPHGLFAAVPPFALPKMFGRKPKGPNFGTPPELLAARGQAVPEQHPSFPRPPRTFSQLPGGRFFAGSLAVGAFLLGTYTVFEYQRIKNLPWPGEEATHVGKQQDLSRVFDNIAGKYDGEIDSTEFWTGMKLMRKRLIGQAKGDVLEVAVGTARNLNYYKADQMSSLTLTDTSKPMLDVAKSKWEELLKQQPGLGRRMPSYFHVADAHRLPAPEGTFDTVVSTFGICSCADPVAELKELARVCKPDGRILLLEHGRATWDIVNEVLDKRAEGHARRWGCWWNRDVLKVVNDAGLDIEYVRRWHFGTTFYIIAAPRSGKARAGDVSTT